MNWGDKKTKLRAADASRSLFINSGLKWLIKTRASPTWDVQRTHPFGNIDHPSLDCSDRQRTESSTPLLGREDLHPPASLQPLQGIILFRYFPELFHVYTVLWQTISSFNKDSLGVESSPRSSSEQRYTIFINLLSICACILTCYLNCKAFWGDEKKKRLKVGKAVISVLCKQS